MDTLRLINGVYNNENEMDTKVVQNVSKMDTREIESKKVSKREQKPSFNGNIKDYKPKALQ